MTNAPRQTAHGDLRGSPPPISALGLVVRNEYYQLMLTLVPGLGDLGVSWNIFSGYSGLVSFGHASFFGLGAYTVTLLLVQVSDVTPWIGIPIGMLGRRRSPAC